MIVGPSLSDMATRRVRGRRAHGPAGTRMTNDSARIPPEAELETLLSSALARAFPGIPRTQFHHQVRFTVRVGHEEFEVDGVRFWRAQGRADIVLFINDRALAVVEVKRGDKQLTDADR